LAIIGNITSDLFISEGDILLRKGIFIVLSIFLICVSAWWGYNFFDHTNHEIANHDTMKSGKVNKVSSLSPSVPVMPSEPKSKNEGTEQKDQAYTRYVTVLNGKVAVYTGHPAKGGVIYMIRDINVSLLPEKEKAQIQAGIWAKDDTDVLNLLEAWSGMIE
jgi:hypothetical protein